MIYKALIPVKFLGTAKSRLEKHLTQQQREILVLDMLHHVLQVLQDSRLLERVYVVSPDARVLEYARIWGAQPLIEEEYGHNAALQAAALKVQHDEYMDYPQALLTISADLPLLCTSDIEALVEQSVQHQVVLAPSRDGTGTNAILVRPPLALPYLFGPGSLQRYVLAARQKGLSSTIYRSISLGLDIDTIEDLYELPFVCSEAR